MSFLRASWERRSQAGGWLIALLIVVLLLPASCRSSDSNQRDMGQGGGGQGGSGPLVNHCENQLKDADETDVDCGGSECSPCALGKECRVDGDCVNDSCAGGLCQAPSCKDGEHNAAETDVDCGGTECASCEAGKKCGEGADCASSVCEGGICAEASCTDQVKNGGESDVDCGGPCEGCEVGKACVQNDDCRALEDDSGALECDGGRCTLVCALGFVDCNEQASDGCEVNVDGDAANCGSCGRICGGSAQTNLTSASCDAGSCSVSCDTGFCPDTSDPEQKCTLPLGTTTNCTFCGEVCSGKTPYCTLKGCKSYRLIEVVNDDTGAVSESRDLTFTHQLQTAAAANASRAVVLLLGNKASPTGLPPAVTYAEQPMTQVVSRYDNQAWSGIYYQLDAALPGEAGDHSVMVYGESGSQRWAARVIELINVHQTNPWIDRGLVSHGGQACDAGGTAVGIVTSPDSWVGSILTEAGALGDKPAPTGNNLSTLPVLTTSSSTTSQGYTFATGTSLNVSWTGCSAEAWSHVVLSLRPAG